MAFKNWDAFVDKYENDDELMELLDKNGIHGEKFPDDDARFKALYDLLTKKPEIWEKEKYDELWLDYGERNYENKQKFKYNPKNIMGELGNYEDIEKDGVKTSALDQFREDYWSASKDKRDYWKTKFEKVHGENSWELAKKVMQADLHNKMMSDIEKKRSDILEGEAEDSPWYDYVKSSLMGLLTPRIKAALKEGRDIGATDILGDITENAAYALFPVGRVGGLAARGISRPLSKVLSQKTARGAGKLLGGALAEFGAPTTVETADWLMGNTDFEPEDILLGGFTNLGVNKGLGRGAGLAYNTLGKKVSGRVPKPIRDRLEGIKTPKERAENLVEDARETLRSANLPEAKAYEYVAKEGKNLPSVTDQQNAIDVLKLAEQADPKLNAQAKEAAENIRDANQKYVDYHKERLNKLEAELNGAGIQHDIGAIGKEEYKKIKENLNKKIDRSKETLIESAEDVKKATKRIEELDKAAKAQEVIDKLPTGLTPPRLDNKRILDGVMSTYNLKPVESPVSMMEEKLGLQKGMFENHPELLSLFGKEFKPTLGEYLGEGLFSWGVNKAGTDTDASMLNTISRGAIDPKEIRKGQYKRREKKKMDKAASVLLENVSRDYDLTDEDRKWLGMIEKNPGMVMGYGKDAGSTDFTLWMIRRGTDLLRNTELARPAFKVE